tara:strand:- start:6897 stop:8183 length:1287 start_codon:yes stop_codon:yes gene_type:complete
MPHIHNIVIAGLGTVGSSTIRMIEKNVKIFSLKSNVKIKIIGISAKNKSKKRGFDKKKYKWFKDPIRMIKEKDVDTVIELIGGVGIAKKICYEALKNNKNLITANKELLALEGEDLAKLAEDNSVKIGFEASVAGGIPIVTTLKNSFSGIKINKITGILNGTSNFILTNMIEENVEFNLSLKKAQELGYAEQQPSNDLNGLDTLHKIIILSTIAFNTKFEFKKLKCKGIEEINKEVVFFAHKLGYTIKLLGISYLYNNKINLSVSPFLISKKKELAAVNKNLNAIIIDSNTKNKTILLGEGAGGNATAMSVVSDLMNIKKKEYDTMYGISYKKRKKLKISNDFFKKNMFFIKVKVLNKSGAIAAITTILKNYNISIKNLFQEEINNKIFNVVILTHNCSTKSIDLVMNKINRCSYIKEKGLILQVLHV